MRKAKHRLLVRSLATLLVLTLSVGMLAACGNGTSSAAPGSASAAPGSVGSTAPASTAPAVNKDNLVIGHAGDIQGVLPYDLGTPTTSAFEKVYDSLIERDPSGQVIPSVAKSWEAIDDRNWLFYLEEGIKFSNGEDLNAESCVATWELISDPDIVGNTNDLTSVIESVTAVDEYTVQFTTIEPYGTLPLRLMLYRVIPAEYYAEVGAEGLREAPVGSGPYLFKSYTAGEDYTVTANPDHWRGAPQIEEVQFVQIPDANSRVMALEAGDVDLIDTVPISEIARLEANEDLTVSAVPSTFAFFAQFNTYKNEALKDVRVRQALNMAVDVDAIIESVYLGYAKKINTPISCEAFENHDPSIERDPYDVDAAKALLKEAGYESGLTLDLVFSPATIGLTEAAQVMAAQIAEIGVTINVVEKEAGLIREQYATQDSGDIVITGLGGTTGAIGLVNSIAFEPGGRYSLWEDPGLGELRKKADAAVDPAEQAKLLSELQQAAKDECPAIVLWESYNIYAHSASLQGWEPYATSLVVTRDAYWG